MDVQFYFKREQLRGRPEVLVHRELRTKLEASHLEIELCIGALEAVASLGPPASTYISTLRLKIGKAILTRRRVVHEVYSRLLSAVGSDDSAEIRELQKSDLAQFHLASKIIGNWTPEMLQSNWRGYCEASRHARDGMRQIISEERRLLYPFLGGLL